MKREFNTKKWVYDRIGHLKLEARRARLRNQILTSILFIANIATLGSAGTALYFLITQFKEVQKSAANFLPFIFTMVSLTFILLTFIMQIVNTVYRSRMKDAIYKASIDSLKIEIVKFENRVGDYGRKDARQLLEAAVQNIEANIRNYKRTKVKFRNAFFGTIVGGK
ncbi:hypothetical protein [Mycoplasma sp. ATU-Cv-703]|uniref:hypothetical protein n=1 Tax=Mycoplasma sp. ATU-Cv-703 TaxID=2498595 RepID=UPI000FDD2773